MMNNRVLLRGNSLSGRDTDEETDHYRQLQGSVGSTLEVFPTQLEGQGGFSKWICELRLGRWVEVGQVRSGDRWGEVESVSGRAKMCSRAVEGVCGSCFHLWRTKAVAAVGWDCVEKESGKGAESELRGWNWDVGLLGPGLRSCRTQEQSFYTSTCARSQTQPGQHQSTWTASGQDSTGCSAL